MYRKCIFVIKSTKNYIKKYNDCPKYCAYIIPPDVCVLNAVNRATRKSTQLNINRILNYIHYIYAHK